MIKRKKSCRFRTFFLTGMLCIMTGATQNAAIYAEDTGDNGVRIEKIEQRTKASIPAGDSGESTRQNFAQKGVSTVCHGIYYGGKAVAGGVGTGLDFTIDAMRKTGRKVFDLITFGKLNKKKAT